MTTAQTRAIMENTNKYFDHYYDMVSDTNKNSFTINSSYIDTLWINAFRAKVVARYSMQELWCKKVYILCTPKESNSRK